MAYDPKRPRPKAESDEPAPVEALLDADDAEPSSLLADPAAFADPEVIAELEDLVEAEDAVEPVELVVLGRGMNGAASNGSAAISAASNGSGSRLAPEVPVAPAPETGTTNRAVLAAVLAGSLLAVLTFVVLRRRRRDRS